MNNYQRLEYAYSSNDYTLLTSAIKSIIDYSEINFIDDRTRELLIVIATNSNDENCRWQATIALSSLISADPMAAWNISERLGSNEQDDVRSAGATVILEHLLEHHFFAIFPLLVHACKSNTLLLDTVSRCSPFGEAKLHWFRIERLLMDYGIKVERPID